MRLLLILVDRCGMVTSPLPMAPTRPVPPASSRDTGDPQLGRELVQGIPSSYSWGTSPVRGSAPPAPLSLRPLPFTLGSLSMLLPSASLMHWELES